MSATDSVITAPSMSVKVRSWIAFQTCMNKLLRDRHEYVDKLDNKTYQSVSCDSKFMTEAQQAEVVDRLAASGAETIEHKHWGRDYWHINWNWPMSAKPVQLPPRNDFGSYAKLKQWKATFVPLYVPGAKVDHTHKKDSISGSICLRCGDE